MKKDDQVLVQLRGGVVGPYAVSQLRQLKGFTLQTLVSFPGSEKWAPAFRVLQLKSYFEGRFDITSGPDAGAPIPSVSPIFNAMERESSSSTPFFGRGQKEFTWADEWFPRVAVLNIFFFAVMYVGWSFQPLHAPLQQAYENFIAHRPLLSVPPIESTLVQQTTVITVQTIGKKHPVQIGPLSPTTVASYQKQVASLNTPPKHAHSARNARRARVTHPLT